MGSCQHPVARLVTFADIDGDVVDARTMHVSARLEAVLTDGQRVVLLNDRGWSSTVHTFWPEGAPTPDPDELPDVWSTATLSEIEDDARSVVGPDEAQGGYSQEEVDEAHWDHLADVLRRRGVEVDAADLSRLPHDVVVGERLRARIGHRAEHA